MATNLTAIFGSAIKVYAQPRNIDRQYVGFAGAHGVVGMHLGTRGRQLVVTGKIGTSGANYTVARANCQAAINAIEAYTYPEAVAADYSFAGTIYYDVVFDKFRLVPDGAGKVFHWTADGYVTADFVCYLRELV